MENVHQSWRISVASRQSQDPARPRFHDGSTTRRQEDVPSSSMEAVMETETILKHEKSARGSVTARKQPSILVSELYKKFSHVRYAVKQLR